MEISYMWDGNTTGDADQANYDDDEFGLAFFFGVLYDFTVQGVVYRNDTITMSVSGTPTTFDLSNLLAVSNPSSYTIRVASGGGLCANRIFLNSANRDFTTTEDGTAITAPGAGSNYYRVVMQTDWATQETRLVVLDVDTGSPPAVTQTWGTTWEVSLATIQITSAGVVTVTDTRRYIPEIQTGNLADDSVDDSKAGNRIAQFYRRQGSNATNWASPGTVTYTPTAVRMQGGVRELTIVNGNNSDNVSVTFPTSFSGTPIIIVTAKTFTGGSGPQTVTPYTFAITSSGFTLYVETNDAANVSENKTGHVHWLAIGPE